MAASCIKHSFGLASFGSGSVASGAHIPDLYTLFKVSDLPSEPTPSGFSATSASEAPSRTTASEAARQEAEKYKTSGNAHLTAKRALEAAADYTKAIELDPENAVYYSNRAAAFTMQGDFDAAIQDCQAALSLNNRYAKAYGRLGAAYLGAGNVNGAIEAYEKAVEHDPDNVGYQSAIDQARRTRGQKGQQESQEGARSSPSTSIPSATGGAGAGGFDLGSLLNNPQIMQMASQMMGNPDAMRNLMNNPQMASM